MEINRCRGCTPICTRNLHHSEVRPDKPLKGVWEVGASGLLSCRAARRGSLAGAAAVYQDVFFCELLGGVPEGRLASVWGGGRLTQGLYVKQAETGLFCPLFDPAARDPLTQPPLSLFLSVLQWFLSRNLLVQGGGGGVLLFFNLERFNFPTVTSPASHLLATARGFNVLSYSEYAEKSQAVFLFLLAW